MDKIRPYGYMTSDWSSKYSDEEFEIQLRELVELYKNFIFPDLFKICSVEGLFEFKEHVRKYLHGEKEIFLTDDLLYEAIQLRKYNYARKVIRFFLHRGVDPSYVDEYKRTEKWLEDGNVRELDRLVDERVRESSEIYKEYFSRHRLIY